MDDEARQLFARRHAVLDRVPSGDVGRDVDVADDRVAHSPAGETERDHIRCASPTEMRAVQGDDPWRRHERHGDHRRVNAFGTKHLARDRRRPPACEGNTNAVGRDVDDATHTDANSDVTPPLDVG